MLAPHADALIGHVRANRDRYVDELKAWIAVPSISADPAYADEVRRSAEHAVARMRAAGLTEAEVLETGGHPVAYGSWLGAPGAPTILIYGHHDVQPVDPLELWTSPPFEAQVRKKKIYGRGAVDDKGQNLMHLAALEAHLRVNGKLPINVKVVIEGEEEIGSPNFEAFLARERERLQCDVVVVSDTAVFAEDVPSLTTSLRGLVHWEVTVHGPQSDLHSGYYGGIVKNPLEALAQIVASLKDAHGRVVVPGFYDDVRELSPHERAEIAALPLRSGARGARARRPRAGRRERPAPARAHVVSPDARGQRDVRRISRTRLEDDHPVVREGEDLRAARPAPRSRAREARGHVVSEAQRAERRARRRRSARRRARRRNLARSSGRRRRGARDGARFRESAGLHRNRRHDRTGLVVRPHPPPPAGADRRRTPRRRDPRAEREVRPRAVLRRDRDDDVSLRRARRGPRTETAVNEAR